MVESGDVERLSHWMLQLAGDSKWRQRLGSEAVAVFNQRFSVSTMSTRYSETYRRVLGHA